MENSLLFFALRSKHKNLLVFGSRPRRRLSRVRPCSAEPGRKSRGKVRACSTHFSICLFTRVSFSLVHSKTRSWARFYGILTPAVEGLAGHTASLRTNEWEKGSSQTRTFLCARKCASFVIVFWRRHCRYPFILFALEWIRIFDVHT